MGGDRRDWSYPVFSAMYEVAITSKEAELMVSTCVTIHSCNNLADEGNQGSEKYKR